MQSVVTKAPWAKGAAGPATGQITPVTAQPGPSIMQGSVPKADIEVIETAGGFTTPVKRIACQAHLDLFLRSETALAFERWLRSINNTVLGKKLSDEVAVSAAVESVSKVLEQMEQWLNDIPPIQQPMRYGNKAYRDWHAKVKENAHQLMEDCLPEDKKESAVELGVYLFESIGNATRIDYGTGHELAFVVMMYCCAKIGFFKPEDAPALILRLFAKYIDLMRKVQQQYLLEPAGSHGVWSLDDYQFLPFYFGAAQLRNTEYKPKMIHDRLLVKDLKDDYMYLAAIQFINEMKTGPFGEHSPILNDISGVKTWDKVNTGMIKMWKAECIGKFPVMQHMRFGSIFNWKPEDTEQQ